MAGASGVHGGAGHSEQGTRPTGPDLRQEAQRLADQAKRRGTALFEGQRRAAAEEIGGMADALRKAAGELGSEQRPATANLAGRAADSLDRLAGSLRERDIRSLLGQAEGYARQHPGLFFGGSVIAGLLLARFHKGSAEHPSPPSGSVQSERARPRSGYAS